jgi:hypothetical protein
MFLIVGMKVSRCKMKVLPDTYPNITPLPILNNG